MFFKQNFSGIDFREKHIAIATVTMDKEVPLLKSLEYISMKDEYIQAGRIQARENISSILKKCLTVNKTLAKRVHLAIPTQHVILRKITSLPDLPEETLGRLLNFEIGESIHLPFDHPIYDYSKLGTITIATDSDQASLAVGLDFTKNNEAQETRSEILFIATSRDLAEDLLVSTEQAGIKALSAEIRGLALQRLVTYLHPEWLKEIGVILDINDESTDIHIYKQKTIVFTRTISIAKETYFVNPAMDDDILILPSEAQKLAEIAATTEHEEKSQQTWDEERYIYDLVNEIEKAQNFYRYSMNERATEFKHMIVTGDFSNSMINQLKERLAFPVSRLKFSSILPSSKFEAFDLLDTCSVAIGLAIRGKEKAHKHTS